MAHRTTGGVAALSRRRWRAQYPHGSPKILTPSSTVELFAVNEGVIGSNPMVSAISWISSAIEQPPCKR